MTKSELVSYVAAETSTTKADAERLVGAAFSAIAASRASSFKAAKALRDAVNG